jgi:hypothetical protein
MKTLLTTAFLMALIPAGTALGDDEDKKPSEEVKSKPVKSAGKRVTLQELEAMLTAMGYEPKPVLNKDGKLVGYDIAMTSGTWTIYSRVDISPNGKNIWLSWTLKHDVDAKSPTEAVLAVFELNYNIFPAYVSYFPKSKSLWLAYRLLNDDVTPAVLRNALDSYSEAVKKSLQAWDKGVAMAKEKAQAGEEEDAPKKPKPPAFPKPSTPPKP